jgi:hypothetical protein
MSVAELTLLSVRAATQQVSNRYPLGLIRGLQHRFEQQDGDGGHDACRDARCGPWRAVSLPRTAMVQC